MATKASLSLPLLPSNHTIALPACYDIALMIFEVVMKLNARVPSSAKASKWPDLEHLLWDLDPPNPSPFCFRFRQWSKVQHSRNCVTTRLK